jgi:hypothetical protein
MSVRRIVRATMTEWLLLLLIVPAVVLPVVYLLGFAGCSFQGGAYYPPLLITSLTLTGPSTVRLTWSGGYAAQIEIERDKKPKPGQAAEPVKTIVLDLTLFATEDNGLSADSVYEYKVRQIFGGDQPPSEWSPPATIETPAIAAPFVTFDAVSGGHTDSGFGNASATWSHTASGNSQAVVVGLRWSQTGGLGNATRTVTYGGTTMQSLGVVGLAGEATNAVAAVFVEFFGVRNPASGAQTISVTVARGASSVSLEACSISYAQVSGFGPPTTPVSGTEAGTSMTQPVSSAANEMVVQMFGTASGAITGYSQTPRFTSANGLLVGDAPGAATISFTASRASGADYAGVAVRLTPVT